MRSWSSCAGRSPGDRELSSPAAAAPARGGAALPELANVRWRTRANDRGLRRAGRLWTLSTAAHAGPFVLAAVDWKSLTRLPAPDGAFAAL